MCVNNCPQARDRLLGRLLLITLALATAVPVTAQTHEYAADSVPSTESAAPVTPAIVVSVPPRATLNEARILGVMPDYQTVRDSSIPVAPLTRQEKWHLVEREVVDPFNIASAFMTAAQSQAGNQTPKYGEGYANFGRRFGAALADCGTQSFFSAGVMANLLHQDPRYFRRGPQSRIIPRIAYSLSRLVIARQDSGRAAFNGSNFGGMVLGIAASNAYYPSASIRGSVMLERVTTSMMGGAIGNLMSEFWPDLQQKFFHRHHSK